ncbi:GNAT family N-acetyltransferase [Acidihalobacter aeolianus]|uniref:GNAT family N-acetyltransferase n=1 Tax=Acidihalobacter aeolianus TaxID=2792603 RepID=A0A1D8K7W6_9GAMM|nr:GNAT family N-acetyltransferase [Acidihalobacter aeolianus]AOV17054.1 GNAT family N-acetyltransferase [Acidihalobacter aeolianus]
MALEISIQQGLGDVDADAWDALGGDRNPFLSHAFLHALETTDCLQPYGWHPYHLLVRDTDDGGRLLAATPLYAKTNSYGEFVFDWAWAGAYERNGKNYYPKLVSSIPYTPATGSRLLVRLDAPNPDALADLMIAQTIEFARNNHLSGMHWLFTPETETERLGSHGLMRRLGCQYHWENRGYADFADFLAAFSSRKRKKVQRERRRVAEQGVSLHVLHGDELDDDIIEAFHGFYLNTFERHMGVPTLGLDFFRTVARALGPRFVLVMARRDGEWLAGAVNFRGADTLYGRYWGCRETVEDLHFEACYYQGIDYCIAEGLSRFEPGAQGEHKIARGFLPTRTWSAHWIADPEFRVQLERFCRHEQSLMERECTELMAHSPYRDTPEAGE